MFPKNDEFKIQGYTEIINFEPTEIIELENLRPWVTKVYFGRYFSNVGSSWSFRHFNKIQLNVISRVDAKNLFSAIVKKCILLNLRPM